MIEPTLRSIRTRALVLLAAAASVAALSGCGESEIQKKAREANDVINTTAQAAEAAKTKALADQEAALEKADRADRKGLAKDIVDAVGGAADQAQADAKQKTDQATQDAIKAAQKAVDQAQDEADKVRDQADQTMSDAAQQLQDSLNTTP